MIRFSTKRIGKYYEVIVHVDGKTLAIFNAEDIPLKDLEVLRKLAEIEHGECHFDPDTKLFICYRD